MTALLRWELWWLLPVDPHDRGLCECSWCGTDDAEDIAILAWEMWAEIAGRRGRA